jgi:VanZ family protein
LIVLLGLTPGKSMPETDLWVILSFDKIAHFGIFSIFSMLLTIGFIKQYKYLFLRYHSAKMAIGVSLLLGLIIEIFQAFIPGRSLEYYDLLANSIGAFAGFGFFYLVYKVG